MENVVIIAVVAVIIGFAAGYIYRQKKRGNKCIGCPYADSCAGKCGGKTE